MAHFAKLEADNLVTQVIVVNNGVIQNLSFPESEPLGVAFCKSLFGEDTNWVQTSYNNNFRLRFAGIGSYYDPNLDIFTEAKPYPSWVYNSEDGMWYPPVLRPQDGTRYAWDESTTSWVPEYSNTNITP
jgi:hypothetical protein